jgi:hypothetical protein
MIRAKRPHPAVPTVDVSGRDPRYELMPITIHPHYAAQLSAQEND